MTDSSQHTTEERKQTFIKRLIIGKVILLGVMGGIAFYLFQTI